MSTQNEDQQNEQLNNTKPKIVLPRIPIGVTSVWPKNLVMFSKPKTGKTTLFSKLPRCLILDLEDGSDFVEAIKIKARSIQDIYAIGAQIIAEGYPYQFIAVDTLTKLEAMCLPLAEYLYSQTAMGKNWFTPETGGKAQYGDILNMPKGAGYPWLVKAMKQIINYLSTLAPNIILSGHIKLVNYEKAGGEFSAADLNLTGKIKGDVCGDSDAIGYLYRKGNQNILSFRTTDEVVCGARPEHLRNAEIVLSEWDEATNTVKTNWKAIYPRRTQVAQMQPQVEQPATEQQAA
jgi:hypothetical protein